MRYLSIDHGNKRIGIAFCDKAEIGVKALPPISNKDISSTIEKIVRLIDVHGIDALVIGVPLGEHNSETQQSIKVRFLSDRLKDVVHIPIEYWNETMSTQKALNMMIKQNTTKKTRKKLIDSYAATVILREFLDYKKYER